MRKSPLPRAGPGGLGLVLGLAVTAAQPPGPGKFFDKIDENKDGTISLEEFQATGERRLARHDLNGDGRVTGEEMAQARLEHHKPKADRAAPGAARTGRTRSGSARGHPGQSARNNVI